jgi:protoheme IX farnesyltransferase
VSALFELTKPRIVLLVVATTVAGFLLAAPAADALILAHTVIGTALVAAGTNALNQWWERDVDARMVRTRGRPLPSGRLSPGPALAFGAGISAVGLGELALFPGTATAALAALTLLSYVLIYTPLKRRSPLALLVGCVPGALPILGGWVAGGGALDPAAWALFGLVFLWQVPHFLALGWLHRDDYRRGGIAALAVRDPDGSMSGRQSAIYALALIPVSLAPVAWGVGGPLSAGAAVVLGGAFLASAVAFARRRGVMDARRVFRLSVVYLPLLLAILVAEQLRFT